MYLDPALPTARRNFNLVGEHVRGQAWQRLGRGLLVGLVVFAALWLTVGVVGSAEQIIQGVLGVIAVAALLLRHRWPVLAVIVTALVTAAGWALGLTADPFLLSGFCLYTLAESRGARQFPWGLFIAGGGVLIVSLGLSSDGIEDRLRGVLLGAVVLGTSWVLGVRTRQIRDESAALSRAEECLRMARDVHDVVSHSLGTIGVRAGVAAHVSSLGESALRDTLREIEDSARKSMGELKNLLEHERADGTITGTKGEVSPLVLTAVIDEIAQAAGQSGISVTLDLDECVLDTPAEVQTTAHRVIQEAVTNVVRHAAASALRITVTCKADRVEVQIADDGRGAGAAIREGHGLRGMRERVALLGGSLTMESGSSGFVIHVALPMSVAMRDSGGAL